VLVFSATSLLGPLKRLLPAPVVEVIALLSDFRPLLLPGSLRLQVLPNFFMGIAGDWLVAQFMLLLLQLWHALLMFHPVLVAICIYVSCQLPAVWCLTCHNDVSGPQQLVTHATSPLAQATATI
jgi:hypothetical protein